MRAIDSIIIHCSATRAGVDFQANDIDRMHKQQGWKGIGYNYVVRLNGIVETGRSLSVNGAHCPGYNAHSVGICYIGGLDVTGKAADTRTPAQKEALRNLVADICKKYDIIEILGHRDTSPDLNDNGIVEPHEWVKMCPCFEVRDEFENFMRPIIIRP